jgi:hypothetical protein
MARRERAQYFRSENPGTRKKGRLQGKRPKSREETPKEGSDSARRYRTATICDCAAQSASGFGYFLMQNSHVRFPE